MKPLSWMRGSGLIFHRKNLQGITLIETMVIIAIFAVLAAFIFPLVNSSINKARRVTSLNNLKTIHMMSELYSTDHNDLLVPYQTREWPSEIINNPVSMIFEFLPRFYGDGNYDIYRRPGDDFKSTTNPGVMRIYEGKIPYSYALNIALPRKSGVTSNVDNNPPRKMLAYPSKTMFFTETGHNPGLNVARTAQVYFDEDGPRGKSAVIYLDGHCALLTREEMGIKPDGSSNVASKEETRTLWYGFPSATGIVQY